MLKTRDIDIIGDIHGHADSLEALLTKLGYRNTRGAWRHPSRIAVFVGDLIDRGPCQIRTLRIVQQMTEAGSAAVVMGNHELNAIGWMHPVGSAPADYLRSRHGLAGQKNRRQHQAFLTEVGEDSAEHRFWVDWFLSLPLWIETPEFRVIHACWDPTAVDTARPHLTDAYQLRSESIQLAFDGSHPLKSALDVLLKGPELALPSGETFRDKDGHCRGEIRIRWWATDVRTYREAYVGPPGAEIPDVPLENAYSTPELDRPVFIGHYWLDAEDGIAPLAPRVACLDYSVAKGGPATAYRFRGEHLLCGDRFVSTFPTD